MNSSAKRRRRFPTEALLPLVIVGLILLAPEERLQLPAIKHLWSEMYPDVPPCAERDQFHRLIHEFPPPLKLGPTWAELFPHIPESSIRRRMDRLIRRRDERFDDSAR